MYLSMHGIYAYTYAQQLVHMDIYTHTHSTKHTGKCKHSSTLWKGRVCLFKETWKCQLGNMYMHVPDTYIIFVYVSLYTLLCVYIYHMYMYIYIFTQIYQHEHLSACIYIYIHLVVSLSSLCDCRVECRDAVSLSRSVCTKTIPPAEAEEVKKWFSDSEYWVLSSCVRSECDTHAARRLSPNQFSTSVLAVPMYKHTSLPPHARDILGDGSLYRLIPFQA